MAARGELGVPGHPAPPEADERFTGDVAAAQLGNAAFGPVTVALALALVQRWGRRVPPPRSPPAPAPRCSPASPASSSWRPR